jgi:hypothetical protein
MVNYSAIIHPIKIAGKNDPGYTHIIKNEKYSILILTVAVIILQSCQAQQTNPSYRVTGGHAYLPIFGHYNRELIRHIKVSNSS